MVVRTNGCDTGVARVGPGGTTQDVEQANACGEVFQTPMIKKDTASSAHSRRSVGSDPASRLHSVNQYLEKNFPDFFAEARFQVGDDDYFLYARFGQYLARTIEQNRVSRDKINRGFTVLNKMARVSARSPQVRHILVSGPLEE